MLEAEHRSWDKSAWGPGPWQDEPDWVHWLDDDTGMPVIMTRNIFGVWIGYVGLPESHVWHGQPRDDIKMSVHGGLTFAGETDFDPEFAGPLLVLCPYKRPWWLGIDFGHAPWDFLPALVAAVPPEMRAARVLRQGVYRDLAYARAETGAVLSQSATVWRHYGKMEKIEMAEFCRQCAIDLFGEHTDFADDFAGVTSPDDWALGKAALVLCEGCGPVQVDPTGACVSNDCLKGHGNASTDRR